MDPEEKIIPRKTVCGFPLDDELILFDEQTCQLFCLNDTAMAVWKGISAGLGLSEVVDVLCDLTNGHAGQIKKDVDGLLDQWRRFGLIHDGETERPMDIWLEPKPSHEAIWDDSIPVPTPIPDSVEFCFRFIDTNFRLKVPGAEEYSLAKPVLEHLALPLDTIQNVTLAVVKDQERYLLLIDGKPLDWCGQAAGIAPMVHANSLMIAYERSQCLLGLHAAAVAKNGRSLLIPGPSGSGKSTLTAALVGSGYSYLADDLVLLSHKPVVIRAIPVAIGLKAGSWRVIQAYYRTIETLPSHLRADNKLIRYLVPALDPMGLNKHFFKANYIMFPQFIEDSSCQLKPLSPAEGLCRLTKAGYDVPGGLDPHSVEQLVDWIASVPCYELCFGQIERAVDAVRILLP